MQRETAEIIDEAIAAKVEGITLLGGEPFDQAAELAELAEQAQSEDLGVITFTGYTHETLIEKSDGHRRLLAATDLLVDGPYIASIPVDNRALVGSANQRFLHLTDRYRLFSPSSTRNRVDVRIAADGSVDLAGFLDSAQLLQLASTIGTRRQRKS